MRFLLLASFVLVAAAESLSVSRGPNLIASPKFPTCFNCGSNSCGNDPSFVRNWENHGICIWDQGSTAPSGQYNNNAVAPLISWIKPREGGISTSINVPAARKKVTLYFLARSSKNASGCGTFHPNLIVKVGGVAQRTFHIDENTTAWAPKSFAFTPPKAGVLVITFSPSFQDGIGCAPTIYDVRAYQD